MKNCVTTESGPRYPSFDSLPVGTVFTVPGGPDVLRMKVDSDQDGPRYVILTGRYAGEVYYQRPSPVLVVHDVEVHGRMYS